MAQKTAQKNRMPFSLKVQASFGSAISMLVVTVFTINLFSLFVSSTASSQSVSNPGQSNQPAQPNQLAYTNPNSNEPIRWGFEIELSPAKFALITHYFDWVKLGDLPKIKDKDPKEDIVDGIVTPHWYFEIRNYYSRFNNVDITDTYLQDNPKALSSLPIDIRQSLLEGLQLNSLALQERTQILDASGKAMESRQGLIAPASRLILPGAATTPLAISPTANARSTIVQTTSNTSPQPDLHHERGGLMIPNRTDFEILNARWRQIPAALRASYVQIDLLGAPQKAWLGMNFARYLTVRDDLGEKEKSFFENLFWHQDGDAIEFKYKDFHKVFSKQEFMDDVRWLARRAGVEREILNPESASNARLAFGAAGGWGSFHFHVSKEGTSLNNIARLLNHLKFLSRIENGILNDLDRNGRHLYRPNAIGKGLLLIFSRDRFESRYHNQPLDDEINWIDRLLSAPDLATSEVELEQMVRQKLTDEIFTKIFQANLKQLTGLVPYLSAQQLEQCRIKSVAEIKEEMSIDRIESAFVFSWSEDTLLSILDWLISPDPRLAEARIRSFAVELMDSDPVTRRLVLSDSSRLALLKLFDTHPTRGSKNPVMESIIATHFDDKPLKQMLVKRAKILLSSETTIAAAFPLITFLQKSRFDVASLLLEYVEKSNFRHSPAAMMEFKTSDPKALIKLLRLFKEGHIIIPNIADYFSETIRYQPAVIDALRSFLTASGREISADEQLRLQLIIDRHLNSETQPNTNASSPRSCEALAR